MTFRYGLIGCGRSGINRHLRAADANPRTELFAVCDLDRERAHTAASRNGDLNAYTDPTEMISAEELDVVSVATPPGTHHEVVTEIAETGVSMLVEKPFATTSDRADEMIDACEEQGSLITEVNNQLFHPVIREAKRKISSGDIGDVRNVVLVSHSNETRFDSRPDWMSSIGGQHYGESLPHRIYLMRHLLGGIEDVRSTATSSSVVDIPEDVGDVAIHVEGNAANGHILTGMQSVCPETALIVGSEKSLLLDHDNRYIYETDVAQGAKNLLVQNVGTSVAVLSSTLKRAVIYLVTEYLRDRTSLTPLQDLGYYSDGHYHQLSEVTSGDQRALTVGPEEIRSDTIVYETVISAIEDHGDK